MPDPIKVALITSADGPHLQIYIDAVAAASGIASVSVADPSGASVESVRAKAGSRFGVITAYPDFRELLSKERPQFAIVALAGDQAPAAIEGALEAGCHVLAEKPACVRVEDFEKLTRTAADQGRHLMLALATRKNPLVQKARDLVASGTIGKLYGATAWFVADQTRLHRPTYAKSWYASKERAGGGHLLWLGIHYVDALQFITGQTIQTVCGFAETVGGAGIQVEDSASVVMEFSGGMVATLQGGYYLDRDYHSLIRLWGSQGWLSMDLVSGTPLEWRRNGSKMTEKFQPEPGVVNVVYPRFVQAAIDAARGNDAPPITGSECLDALRPIFALYAASSTGRTQRLARNV